MITQQVASYLIKKMDSIVRKPSETLADATDRIFQAYLSEKAQMRLKDVISDGIIDNEAIVEAFQWRAADLVRLNTSTRKSIIY